MIVLSRRFRCTAQCIAIATLIFPAVALTAQEAKPLAAEIESVVVTGQYLSRRRSLLTEPVMQITALQLETAAAPDMVAALATVSGVYASREGGAGGVNSISIRGGEPNFTVVLIDGVAMNDPTNTRGGSFDLAALTMGEVDRIELVRGPQSVIYGADALAGVINVLTNGPRRQSALSVRGEAGEFGQRQWSAAATLAGTRQQLAVRGGRRDAGHLQRGSSLELDTAAADYIVDFLPLWQLRAGARRSDFEKTSYPEQSGGPQRARADDLDKSDGNDATVYLNLSGELFGFWRTQINGSRFHHLSDYVSPGVDPYTEVPPNSAESDYERHDRRWQNRFSLGAANLDLGVDRRYENAASRGSVDFSSLPPEAALFLLGLPAPPADSGLLLPVALILDTDFTLRRTTRGRYAQLEYALPLDINLVAGWRRDRVAGGYQKITRRFGLVLPLGDQLQLHLGRAQGFKSPSFFALGHSLVGNPDLRPELARSDELRLLWQALPELNIETAIYRTRFDDLIDFDAENFTNVNRDRVYSSGAELAVSWRPGTAWDLAAQFSYNDLDVKGSSRKLANRPQWRSGIAAGYRFSDQWRLHLRGQFVGRRFATSLHSGEATEHELDAQFTSHAVLNWKPSGAWRLYAALDNAGNHRYQEAVGFPAAGRSLRVGFEWELTRQ